MSLLPCVVLFLCIVGTTASFVDGSVSRPSILPATASESRHHRRLSSWHPSTVRSSSKSENANAGPTAKIKTKSGKNRSRISPSTAADKNTHARFIAAHAILDDQRTKITSNFPLRVLEADANYRNLKDQRDRTFARLLVATVERRKGQLDKVLAHCNNNAKGSTGRRSQDRWVRAALRIGAAQLLFLEALPHAAVKETVDILRMDVNIKVPESKIKFVNAVLRRISREGREMLQNLTSPLDNLSPWLQDEWKETWGEQTLHAIVEAGMTESPIYISVKFPLGASEAEKSQQLTTVHAAFDDCIVDENVETSPTTSSRGCEILPHGSIYVPKGAFSGAISNWPLYAEGEWWVQDASATLPAQALYNALSGKLDDMDSTSNDNFNDGTQSHCVVDMCAAPGGKTAQLLSLGFEKVTAVEAVARRARQLQSNLQRLHLEDRCEVVVADGTQWTPSPELGLVTGILLDVPCTATGTASRRPDVFRRDSDLSSILDLQQQLAVHCADNVLAVGGVMVYATCSLLKQESEEQVQKLLSRHGHDGAVLKTIPFQPGEIPGFDDAIDPNGWLRVIPGLLPGNLKTCDGFFVARLKRVS